MKTTSRNSRKTKPRLVPAPKIDPNTPSMNGKQLIRWLKAQGAEPIEPELKRRLIASGNWGMPDE
jgi:hypothetical protein